jgi:hypothetical protein
MRDGGIALWRTAHQQPQVTILHHPTVGSLPPNLIQTQTIAPHIARRLRDSSMPIQRGTAKNRARRQPQSDILQPL